MSDVAEPIIRIKNLHKWFPGVHALNGVQFDLYPGEVHALVGENGAGKSTLIKVIAGIHDFTEGSYEYDGKEANFSKPADAINAGVSVIYQELNVVEGISVAENIFFGQLPRDRMGRMHWKELNQKTEEILKRLHLNVSPKMRVAYLSTAQKQMVEIGKALSHNAKVIVMDEPTSALAPREIKALFEIIQSLKEQNIAVIYISHKMDEIFEISDRVTVMRDGQWVSTRPTAELTPQEVIATMVGRDLSDMYPRTPTEIGETVLSVEGLTTEKVRNISFSIRAGEIVGFSGLMGAGRSEMARGVFGADQRLAGSVKICGKEIPRNSTSAAKMMGVGYMSEDRKSQGNLGNMSVAKNITISSIRNFMRHGRLNTSLERAEVQKLIDAIKIRTPSQEQLIVKLSGGNQQKTLLARWLIDENLKLLIIDEPTRGIDVGAKAEIYRLIDELTKRGLAVCMISSEMPEILSMCDRIYVMRKGQICGEFTHEEASQEKLLACAIGAEQ